MKIIAIIQARMNSSRLPGKVMKQILNKPILYHIVKRVERSKLIDNVIIATTNDASDDKIYDYCQKQKICIYRGEQEDVFDRFYQITKLIKPEIIIRITCDCGLIDPIIIDNMIEYFQKNEYDYINNTALVKNSYPDGMDVEICNYESLMKINKLTKNNKPREHFKYCFYNHADIIRIKKYEYVNNKYNHLNLNTIHLSIDNQFDFNLIKNIYQYFKHNMFNYEEVLEYLNNNSQLLKISLEDKKVSIGPQKYIEAKKFIPGGTQLLSKRPELFLPNQWPTYYNKVNGIEVADLDGNKLIDMCYNGIGSTILGACDPYVNSKVHRAIDKGNMSTLNSPYELKLAKLLCKLHPWADMVRYARSGGEACTIAVRISRAYTGRM